MNKNNWTRRDFLKGVGATTASLLVHGCSANGPVHSRAGSRANIVFIMTDDQGPWAFGAAPDANARTPNIDRLADEGARLIRYFVTTPVCSPSRAELMTSRYSTEVGIPDYLSGRNKNLGLDRKFPVWPRILAENGYATALVGKWHLGQKDEYYPTHYGYKEFTGFRVGGAISKDPMVEIKGKVRRVQGYTPDILADYAIDFIRRKRKKPFMLSLHFWAPHANTANRTPDGDRTWLPLSDADWKRFKDTDPVLPEPDYPKLDVPRTKRMMREYLASVASADRNIGRVLDVLDELKLAEKTIVIFTADNGYNMGHNGIWHKGNGRWLLLNDRGPRPNMYDNSLLVPAIVRWPRIIRPGRIINQTITNLDWFPTILAMAGLDVPDNIRIRGRNFLGLLKGEKPDDWDNDLFAQYTMWPWDQTGAVLRTYRTRQWKLVRDFEHENMDELYNLKLDPDETRNLIDSRDPTVRRMGDWLNLKLLTRMQVIRDPALKLHHVWRPQKSREKI